MCKFILLWLVFGIFVSIFLAGCCSEIIHTSEGDPALQNNYGYMLLPNLQHPGNIEKQRAKFSQFDHCPNENYSPRINVR
ncbi:MAG: hypothetical protein LBT09_07515 [Planctomycetaceae bacterium]|jgi:hypothetical protein|nr:hypothetical protein [Planctomycetaceae bacterium]